MNLDSMLKNDCRVILYGGGRIGKNIKNLLNSHNVRVSFFIDQNATLRNIDGIPVITPDSYLPEKGDTVIVCLYYKGIAAQIKETLRRKNIEHILDYSCVWEFICDYSEDEKEKMCRLCAVRRTECSKSCLKRHDPEDILCFEELDLAVTSACVLNCRECVARVPEYREKNVRADMELGEFRACWETFLSSVNHIKILGITG